MGMDALPPKLSISMIIADQSILFVRGVGGGDKIIIFLVDRGIEDPNSRYKWATIGPASEEIAFRWRANDGPTLKAGLVALCDFQGIWTSIANKPYIFVIFQGGSGPLSPLWIRPCVLQIHMGSH